MDHQFSLLAYRNRLVLLISAVALSGALVACDRMPAKPDPVEPVEPVDPTPVEPTAPPLPAEAAAFVATSVEQSLSVMLLALSDPETLVVPRGTVTLEEAGTDPQAHPFEACQLESSGDATDNDADNFAENERRSFGNMRPGDPLPPECEVFSLEGLLTVVGSGSLVIDDKDDTDAESGVTLEAITEYRVTLGGSHISITSDVSFDVSRSAGAADYDIDHEGALSLAEPFSRTDLEGDFDATLTGTFASGTVGVQGGFTISTTPADCSTLDPALQAACQQAVQELESGGFTLQVSTSDLVYDTEVCATTFTGGSFEVQAGASVIKSTYDGCGPATVTYNGQPVPPEMPS